MTNMMKTPSLDFLIVSDFTVQPLADALHVDDSDPPIISRVAPYGQVVPTLTSLVAGTDNCDGLIVWTRPEAISPTFRRRLEGDLVSADDVFADIDALAALLREASAHARFVFVPTWTRPYYERGVGMLDWRPGLGIADLLARMNLRLADQLRDIPHLFLLDAERWLAAVGPRAVDPKLWFMGKVAFGAQVYPLAASDIKAAVRGVLGKARKLLLVDLDDTLWGGTVGETGWQSLRVGGVDPIGEAFAAFQRALKSLTRSGVLLGIISKNDESVALDALRSHPEMILRPDDFAGWRINWDDKASNIISLVEELNLGLESVVFIDDHPAERARVREALPQVFVPDWPTDPMLYTKTLYSLACFDKPTITSEDARRTEQYRVERVRIAERSQLGLQQWLSTLQLSITIEPLNAGNLKRAAQLLNKTNQFNLTTRRMTEAELSDWATQPQHRVALFRAADRFGDYGLVGLVGLSLQSNGLMTDYLLSCRAMGRGIEETMLAWAIESCRYNGIPELRAKLLPTARNRPCLEYFEGKSGWKRHSDYEFIWNVTDPYPYPAHVDIKNEIVSDMNTPTGLIGGAA